MRSALRALEAAPPSFGRQPDRERAFLKLGEFLEASIRPGCAYDLHRSPNPVWQEIAPRLVRAVDASGLPAEGVTLWQMYNSGVIIRSDDVIMGLDVIPILRTYGWDEPAGLTLRTARALDFLLVTHGHVDHYDKPLIRACLEMGKPVCLPESLAQEWESNSNLYPVGDGWEISLNDIRIRARKAFHVWRAGIDDVPLVTYEVTTQRGYAFLFSGDADYTKVFEKTPGKEIDLLFLPWRNPNAAYEDGEPGQVGRTADAVRIALERIAPAAVLFEHYAELEHMYGGFPASYDMVARVMSELAVPCERLFWGEQIRLA